MEQNIQSFVERQKELLTIELEAENNEEEKEDNNKNNNKIKKSQSNNGSLHKMYLNNISLGLYGRSVIQFIRRNKQQSTDNDEVETSTESDLLPSHRIKVGDEVEIRSNTATSNTTSNNIRLGGVVSEIEERSISIALFNKNDSIEDDTIRVLSESMVCILPKSSVEVHRKMIKSLNELGKNEDHPVVRYMFSSDKMKDDLLVAKKEGVASRVKSMTDTKENEKQQQWYNINLDASQKEAVNFAVHSPHPVTLIHGPPGTGKTTTLTEIIHQITSNPHQPKKILVTASSNVAVDNLLQSITNSLNNNNKLQQKNKNTKKKPHINWKNKIVRIGHPARISSNLLKYSLESLVHTSEEMKIVQDVVHELQDAISFYSTTATTASKKKKHNAKQPQRTRPSASHIRSLRKEIKTRHEKILSQIISNACIVLCTNIGAANEKILKNVTKFDVVIIDEAAQALEASCWIPILKTSTKVILAGDHCQLPPTIKNKRVEKELSVTLFDRAVKRFGSEVCRMLTVQYRMNQVISNWCSEAMYNSKLIPAEHVKDWLLSDLDYFNSNGSMFSNIPLLFIDTTGCGEEYTEVESDSGSKSNLGEANIVQIQVKQLLKDGLRPQDIAIISPYNSQVEHLRNLLLPTIDPNLQIKSVDGFQGGEREAVILSLVRSNSKHQVGFLSDKRRLNVAITRARKHICVIGNVDTCSKDLFLKDFVDYCTDKGEYWNANQLLQAYTNTTDCGNDDQHLEKEGEEERKREHFIQMVMKDIPISDDLKNNNDDKIEKKQNVCDGSNIMTKKSSSKRNKNKKIPKEASTSGATSLINDDTTTTTTTTHKNHIQVKKEDNIITLSSASNKSITPNPNNNLLSNLAKERQQRQKQQPPPPKTSSKTKNKKPNKKQKQPPKKEEYVEDDMDFLNQQIQKNIAPIKKGIGATGVKYCTIVNGIIHSKPQKSANTRNAKSEQVLKDRLKEMEHSRSTKVKKKK